MVQSSSNPFSVQIRAAAPLSAAFTLVSAAGGASLPFSLGHAFKKGDVPAGKVARAALPGIQVVPKNHWPDGSLKFAVVSGRATLAPGVPLTVPLVVGTPAAAAASLSTDTLRGTGITASVGAASFGSASWTGTDWNSPLMAWISGPEMSSWIYRKQIGSDAHLVAWLEVRLFAGGAVEVLPWVENGYLNVPGPTSKSALYTFALGGTTRFSANFDLANHCRTVLVAGTSLSHWLGNDPRVGFAHDRAYMMAARVVPNYSGVVSSTATVLGHLPKTFAPLQQGGFPGAMGNAGYQPAIGLLPEWDVLYLTSTDARVLPAVQMNVYSAGRYGIHFRDETTQRPIAFSRYPNLVLNGNGSVGVNGTGASTRNQYTPQSSGTGAPVWDLPHHPSIGYMAYLLTARFYFLEEIQFAATVNYLKQTDSYRSFSGGTFASAAGANTTRGAAWAIRTLAQAASATPDDHPLKMELCASLAANGDLYHSQYVATPNNPFGWVKPYSNYTTGAGYYSEASWMQDFFTAAVGYAIDLDLPMPAASKTKLAEFFVWKAQSVIGRLGGTGDGEYLYADAALYYMPIAPTESPNFDTGKGPWFASWGDVYAKAHGKRNPGVAAPLRGGNYPNATSYWGNMMPAIAYAVEHKVPGALAAYQRMINAPNWKDLANGFHNAPVWSVKPRN